MANKVGRPLRVEWEDAWSNGDTWTAQEAQETKPLIMTLFGYCVRDDKAGITLTMEHDPQKKKYRIIWHVPRAMIRKVTVLK